MNVYKTAEIAKIIGIHPNTVRLYEKMGLIPKPIRKANGYRTFTDVHLEQFKLARLALRAELLQNGLRKKAVLIIKTSAIGDYDNAIKLSESYLEQISAEQKNAEEAVKIAKQLLSKEKSELPKIGFSRKEAANYLHVTIDTLRNWEMNGLLSVRRKKNGYRVYNEEDIQILKITRSLRCANYSLSSILRMLNSLADKSDVDIREVIDTPKETDDIIYVCDRLLTSLCNLYEDAKNIIVQLEKMKNKFTNPPL